jgi:hypothetical protein
VDSAGDLTEASVVAGVPAAEHVTPSGLHGVIGTGYFNFKKSVGESDFRTALIPFFIVIYKDRAYWGLGGSALLCQSGDHLR